MYLLRQVECVPRHPFEHRDLSGMRGADIRPALLRELTDLYIQKPSHTAEEERHFTELALRLIEHVDAAERAWLGARLAAYRGAPLTVILRLAQPDAGIPLPDLEPEPSPQNLPRLDVPRAETLSDTFFNALPSERRLILLHLDYAPIAPAIVSPPADVVPRLEQAAMARERDLFAAALEQGLSITSACAERIACDTTGEAAVAALKALAVPSPAAQRILLFLDPAIGRSPDVYFSLVRLYDEIDEKAARRLVAIWRRDNAVPERQGKYRTHLFDDAAPRARDFADHAARPAAGQSPVPLPQSRPGRK